jgi:hypothetical protein
MKGNTDEKILVGLIAAFSLLIFFFLSEDLSRRAKIFPQVTSAIVIVTGALILSRSLMPKYLLNVLFPTDQKDESSSRRMNYGKPDEDENEDGEAAFERAVFTVLTGCYLIVGYLVGLVWATPLFVFVYAFWKGLNWVHILILTFSGFMVGFLFNRYLVLGLNRGYLHDVWGSLV